MTTRALSTLADFIAPVDSGLADYLGGFVTAGLGVMHSSDALSRTTTITTRSWSKPWPTAR
jgi:cobalamin-dependent methionine synthase I